MNYRNSYTSFTAAFALLFAVFSASVLTGCDSTTNVNDPPEQPFDATGTLTGRVMDRVTDDPIEGATVGVELSDTLTATTDVNGAFTIEGLPANKSDNGGAASSSSYNVYLTTPGDSPYRSTYTAEVEVVYGSQSGGSGPGNNLAASVTFELAKLNGTINGALTTRSDVTGSDIPAPGIEVVLFQTDFGAFGATDGGGSPSTDVVQLASTTTTDDGTYTFENVEEGGTFDLRAVAPDGSIEDIGPDNVFVGGDPGEITLDPSTSGSVGTIGTIKVFESDVLPPFEATLLYEGEPLTDDTVIGELQPTFLLAFSQPVEENAYTTPDPDAPGDNIAKDISIDDFVDDIGQLARTPGGDIALDVSFNSARDTLSMTPVDPLPADGAEYSLNDFIDESELQSAAYEQTGSGVGDGFRFLSFITSVNQDVPAAPVVTVTEPTDANGDLNPSEDGDFDVELEIDQAAGDDTPLEGYRVFYRTADTDDDFDVGDDEFEVSGDVPVSRGDTEATQTIFNVDFEDSDENREDIVIRVEAVSINGATGPAETVTIEDPQ